ncbi:Nucleolar protein 16 [Trapelia coarctata]|nr:Nucleolar protein 16 [Trapelia coarctata]
MGRELQKKKNRSSIPKVKHKPKSKRLNVQGNAIVASNWDQNLTLAQNYRRLGLTSKLNARTGGTEKPASQIDEIQISSGKPRDPLSLASKLPTLLNPTEALIERDPSTGAIVRVIRPPANTNPLNDPLNDLSDEQNEEDEEEGSVPKRAPAGIIQELEEQASMEVKKRPRQQSGREQEWIAGLVKRHGDDYGRMARDRKLNPYQQGEGDLRRRVNVWKRKHNDTSE